MARWRLINAHYLNTVDNQWEYKETSRDSGRQVRKIFDVPRLFDPNDPNDCNYPGEVIVCYEGKGQSRDHIFTGPPTPEMEPLDDEAKAISEAESPKWIHPIDSLPGQGYNDNLLRTLERQLDAIARKVVADPAPPVPVSGIDPAAFAKMQEQIAELAASNAALQAQLLEKAEAPARRA